MSYSKGYNPSGRWIEEGMVWKKGGMRYFSKRYLKLEHPDVSPKRWKDWATRRCPYLNPQANGGRLLALKVYYGDRPTLVYAERDIIIIRRRLEELKRQGEAGRWLVPYRIWQELGKLWLSAAFLAEDERGKGIEFATWHMWAKKPCPHLDQTVNRGRIRTKVLPRPRNHAIRVFLQDDTEQVITRRADATARQNDPANLGRWIGDDIFQLTRDVPEKHLSTGELLFRHKKFAAYVGVKGTAPCRWRKRGHTALDASVNGGRLRFLRLPVAELRSRKGGPRTVTVSSQSDADRIRAWREDQRGLIGKDNGRKGETIDGVAKLFNIDATKTGDRVKLSIALREFRNDFPTGAWQVRRWEANRTFTTWHFDPALLRSWLGTRTIREVAEAARRVETPRSKARREKREHRVETFLKFALTEGQFSLIRFERFLAHPPVGLLEPCAEVPAANIWAWAKEAKIPVDQVTAAKAKLPIVWRQDGKDHGKSYWRLTGPVGIEAPRGTWSEYANGHSALVTTLTTTSEDNLGRQPPRKRGRVVRSETDAMQKFCYEGYVRGDKLVSIRRAAATQFGSLAPKEDAHVTTYATRYAKRHRRPLIRSIVKNA
jgi:hypothetical protein